MAERKRKSDKAEPDVPGDEPPIDEQPDVFEAGPAPAENPTPSRGTDDPEWIELLENVFAAAKTSTERAKNDGAAWERLHETVKAAQSYRDKRA